MVLGAGICGMKSFGLTRPRRWVLLAFLAMILTGLMARHGLLPHPLEGGPLPDFVVTPLDGEPYVFQSAAGKVVILEFWTSWCVPCMVALPRLEALHRWIEEEGVAAEVHCINVGESADRAAEVWSRKQFTMPLLLDRDRMVAEQLHASALPTTVMTINRRVEWVEVGTRRIHVNAMKDRIMQTLKMSPTPP